jgi:hypothetical protein
MTLLLDIEWMSADSPNVSSCWMASEALLLGHFRNDTIEIDRYRKFSHDRGSYP